MTAKYWFLSLLILLLLPATSPAPLVWREGEDWTYERTDEEDLDRGEDAGAQMAVARNYEQTGQLGAALSSYRHLVRQFPGAGEAPEAQFKVAQLEEKAGDFARAFNSYQRLIERYPRSDRFDQAIERQFEIATLFLEGERMRLLGIPTFPSMERAVEMFQKVVENAPFSRYAPMAQFNIGLAREKQGHTAQAIAAYQETLDRYPDSEVADDAMYQVGYTWMQASRSGSYDQSATLRAIEAFEDFIFRFPESEKVPQARENLEILGGREVEGTYKVARFYDHQKSYRAAVIYYNDVVRLSPDSEEADRARVRIDEIRAMVGEDVLQPGPERAETGEIVAQRRRMQAQVDTAARPDYVGPPLPEIVPDEVAPAPPQLRISPDDFAPLPLSEPGDFEPEEVDPDFFGPDTESPGLDADLDAPPAVETPDTGDMEWDNFDVMEPELENE